MKRYTDFAKYYDFVYGDKQYKKEADFLIKCIRKYKKSKGKNLLEFACGTGKYLQYLKEKFNCVGVDLSENMLQIAKKKVKKVPLKIGNMINFSLNKQFDVVVCLFSSLGYVKTYTNLERTINNFSKHLKSGGVLLIQPWLTKKTYKVGDVHMTVNDTKDLKVCRMDMAKTRGNISIIDMHLLVAEKNKGVKYFVERHELGMFEHKKIIEYMKKARMTPKIIREPLRKRKLIIGVKK